MNIFCLGINHRTAPIEIRERMWFSDDEIRAIMPLLHEKQLMEAVLVSTCNRTELYYVPGEQITNGESLWQMLVRFKHAEETVQEKYFYSHSASEAVEQALRVASGIDSMVVGDVQILNQMKEAFGIAQESRCTGIMLNRLFHTAFHVGKRARTETEIGEGAVSISYAAAELATKIFEDLSKRTALLVGAGETGKLTAKHLMSRNLGTLLLANRTRQRADDLVVQLGGRAVDYEKIVSELANVDIAISAVEAPTYILSVQEIQQIMKARSNRPLFIIDIGVPRNIDPRANSIDNVFLHDIDALNHVIDQSLAHRRAEIPKIHTIIQEELGVFMQWHDSLQVTPTIQQLREQFEAIRTTELEKFIHHFPSDKKEALEMLTKRIVNKILHAPMVNLKNGTNGSLDSETRNKIDLIRRLFGLTTKHHS
ncbi:MAG: glutamyl-tRNA reductase [Ignavibacteriae bacterium]|nr:glutamyl-tRNA reductase [Ignavibacteria bacterium]MBI3363951.1 glutamyl-tRNA reductase [Ignavibacteriota bacterium]